MAFDAPGWWCFSALSFAFVDLFSRRREGGGKRWKRSLVYPVMENL